MSEDRLPESDRLGDAPHPRDATRLFGQAQAEQAFLDVLNADRLHHGWMISGPRGVGKATLAWRMAAALIAEPPGQEAGLFGAPPPRETLDLPDDHPVARRMAAGSEPGLSQLTRPWDEKLKRFKADITVDEVRKLKSRFTLAAADGGWRVCIVDAADDLNTAAANAFLKLLEEPPERTTFLLVTHQPTALLPTIRSRCRMLRCAPLGPEDMAAALAQAGHEITSEDTALAALSGGSVGRAFQLLEGDGLRLYGAIVSLLGTLPRLDRARAGKLAEAAAARGNEAQVTLIFDLLDVALARLARAGATGALDVEAAPGEAQVFARLAPSPAAARQWAARAQEVTARARHGRAVNLDPGALILDTLFKLSDVASRCAA
ncbi:DNA polymerase III subunit delta' [Primorskyibacter sp. S187A]|uniref:DNA polymerase III subunit delta' n=1 Tax=Primorskyibacter sp. S187A TaxID=3415130 RepID=UPI003C7CE333